MKFLLVHQNFPGQFLHLVRHLVKSKQHEIVFLTESNPNVIHGVRKVPYRKPPPVSAETHWAVREFDAALRRADIVAQTAANLKQLGFTPDIIIGHHGWGEMLNLPDVWPGVPMLGYMEFFYHTDGIDVGFDPEFPIPVADFPRVRAKNAVNHLALNLGGHGQTPTQWQLSTYPPWAREKITLLPEGVDLAICAPDAELRRVPLKVGEATIGPEEKLVTYVARDLEPYRGFHIIMRTLPLLLKARKDLRVVIVGGDGVSYGGPAPSGTWRETMMAELGGRIDPDRVLFPGRVDYTTYLGLLARSDAHVYLTYPFVASWSLREALARGCAVVASDTQPVREFITHGRNGMLVPFFDIEALARQIIEVIEDPALSRRIRAGARRYAQAHLDMADYLAGYEALIRKMTATCA
jgi:glycosyltransferase involved in cell wall biosynthesis